MSTLFLPGGKTCEFTKFKTSGKSPDMSPNNPPRTSARINRPRCGFRNGNISRYGPASIRANSLGEGLFFPIEFYSRVYRNSLRLLLFHILENRLYTTNHGFGR